MKAVALAPSIPTSLVALVALVVPVAPLVAQNSEALEEVLVTGVLKEDASLLETPLSVTALDSESLERRGINSLADLIDGQLPSVRVQPYANNPSTISIGLRGLIAADAGSVGVEAPVAINIDNVYLGRMQGLSVDMVEMERLEVLRGPQGTLFGRNAIGGVVSMTSKKPTGELGVSQRLTAGSDYGEFRSVTRVDLPRMGGVAARLSALVRTYDGYIENPDVPAGSDALFNLNESEDFHKNDQTAFRLALNWEGDGASVDYSFDHATIENSQAYFQASNGFDRIGITDEMKEYCQLGRSTDPSSAVPATIALHPSEGDFGKYALCSTYATTLASLALIQGASSLPGGATGAAIGALGYVGFVNASLQSVVGNSTGLATTVGRIAQGFAASGVPGLDPVIANARALAEAAIADFRGNFAAMPTVAAWIPATASEQTERQESARLPLYLAGNETTHMAHALTVKAGVGDLALQATVSYRELEEELNNNYNGALTGFGVSGSGGATGFDAMGRLVLGEDGDLTEQEQLSVDVQLSGRWLDDRLGFITGFYHFSEDIVESQGTFHSTYDYVNLGLARDASGRVIATPYPIVIPLLYGDGQPRSLATPVCLTCVAGDSRSEFNSQVEFESTSQALYGQATYAFTEQFDLTFGLRFSQDDREGVSLASNSTYGVSYDRQTYSVITPTEVDDDNLDFSLIASYDLDDRANVYGRLATGYKSGGISRRAISFNTFEQETLTSVEFGYKGRLWDDRLSINLAAFMMQHKDKQASLREVFFRADATVANTLGSNFLGTTDINGAEIEVSLRLGEGLRLGLDMTLLDWDVPAQEEAALCPDSIIAQLGACAAGPGASGFPEEFFLSHAPDMALAASIDYAFAPFAFGTLDFHLDANMSGDYHPNATDAEIDGYTIVNARAALRDVSIGPGSLDVALWSKNLTDEEYVVITTGAGTVYNSPATFGVDLIYEF